MTAIRIKYAKDITELMMLQHAMLVRSGTSIRCLTPEKSDWFTRLVDLICHV